MLRSVVLSILMDLRGRKSRRAEEPKVGGQSDCRRPDPEGGRWSTGRAHRAVGPTLRSEGTGS